MHFGMPISLFKTLKLIAYEKGELKTTQIDTFNLITFSLNEAWYTLQKRDLDDLFLCFVLFLKWRERLAGALKEMQSEGKADQVFQPISASNGSILPREDYQPVIKVTTTCFFGYIFVILLYVFIWAVYIWIGRCVLDEILLMWLNRDAFIVQKLFSL